MDPSDREFADELKRAITNRGHTVQELSTSVSSGSVWADAVQLTLKSSDAVVLIVPEPGSPGANNAFFEVGAARALGKPVLAVMPDRGAIRGRDFPVDLVGVLVVDAAQKPIESVVDTLVHALPANAEAGA